jgi:predicted O-methyltransferase YrrM
MDNFRRFLINFVQRYNRRFNSAYLENTYQASYLDLARRTDWLKETPLSSPSGGTASFSLLYVLLSILREKEMSKLLEIGVGQSTKILSQYVKIFDKKLTLIDDDEFWVEQVAKNVNGVTAIHAKLVRTVAANKTIQWYDCKQPPGKFDFLLIDGPMAYTRSIRYNRLGILNWLPDIMEQEFIILVDDTNRQGESMLVDDILKLFEELGVDTHKRDIIGGNSQTIIATPKFGKYLYL